MDNFTIANLFAGFLNGLSIWFLPLLFGAFGAYWSVYIVRNWTAGRDLLKDGILNSEFMFDRRRCTCEYIGKFRTRILDLDDEYETNILPNSKISQKVMWIHKPGRKKR